jgi:DNA-binding Xre family transcriptional regulator
MANSTGYKQPPSLREIFSRNIDVWLFTNSVLPAQLAEAMLISPNTIHRLRRGELSTINFETLEQLEKATKKPIGYFFTIHPEIKYP